MTPSTAFVRQSLAGHSWLGVMAGALMYLVCLSGTLAVFYEEFERWEQPYAPEFVNYDARGIDETFNDYLESDAEVTPHMYVVLPTDAVPRARIATENDSWFLNPDGTIAAPENNQWTEMLLDLHLYLNLPQSWGMLVVSALGAILVALIVSGLFAHPRIFRDAFSLRSGGSRHLEQADIHNRLSVWGAPFHLMIAITGAWFGLVLPFLALASHSWFDGDRQAAIESVFGAEPELAADPGRVRIAKALRETGRLAPDAEPLFIVVHDAGEPGQYISVAASQPGRLIYAENYLFDADGQFLRTDGFSDGAAGKQVLYSIYRLHFGHFAGPAVKILYGLLGFALTVVAVTGINVWLARRRRRDYLARLWAGIVWGAPLALAAAAAVQIALGSFAMAVFWPVLLAAASYSVAANDDARAGRILRRACGATLLLVVIAHVARFGGDALHGMPAILNAVLMLVALAVMPRWFGVDRHAGNSSPAPSR